MAGGVWLARTKGREDAGWRGQGWGIVVQGAFLFLFDLYHAMRVPRGEDSQPEDSSDNRLMTLPRLPTGVDTE